jgi:very-short-patch-repair endonuclease
VEELAQSQAGIVSRRQLYAMGIRRGEVRANVRAGRWRRVRSQSLSIHCGPLDQDAKHWAAVFEAGPRAFLDGESALLAAGLEHYTVERIRVSVPRGARIRGRFSELDIRQTRRWRPDDVEPLGLPRSRAPVAAVRAGLWAMSNRQAALLVTMSVQQGLTTPAQISAEMLRVRRDKRRLFLCDVLLDLVGGVRSLGELDVVRGCRERGLPEPDKQVVRRAGNGTYFLDFRWDRWKVVVEVDGIQHAWVEQVVGDALRQNAISITGDTVLRLPLLGLRVCPDEFFAQIEDALRAAGCPLHLGLPA